VFTLKTPRGHRYCRPELSVQVNGVRLVVDVVNPDGDSGRLRDLDKVRSQYGHPTLVLRVSWLGYYQSRPDKLRELLVKASRK
jgi:hypothetical protein